MIIVAELQQNQSSVLVQLEQERANIKAEKMENRKLHDQLLDMQQKTFDMFRSNNSNLVNGNLSEFIEEKFEFMYTFFLV